MFDTAEAYAAGQSEIEMGRVIKELGLRRTDLIITTKLFWGLRNGPNDGGLSRKHIIEGTQESLQRLQLDYVDVIFAHRPDNTVPMEEIVRAFNYVIDKGWAFYWATSEWSALEIEEAYQLQTTPAALALAWVARNPNTSTVILGATSTEQLKENLKALEVLPRLTPEIMEKIEVILSNKPSPPVNYGRPILDSFGRSSVFRTGE
ncbi:hypothetical protein C0993_002501 [Termitomyces sp. T159_Od127]|nr:hypothetical protein C0993_002501 [Termitomyces sp. T159_Od127]